MEGWKGKGKVGFKGPVTLRCGACREVVTAVGVKCKFILTFGSLSRTL